MSKICWFCHKCAHDVKKLIQGLTIKAPGRTESTAFICNECIDLAVEILKEEPKEESDDDTSTGD